MSPAPRRRWAARAAVWLALPLVLACAAPPPAPAPAVPPADAAAAPLPAPAAPARPADPVRVRYAVPSRSTSYLPWYLAIEQGYFREQGLEVELLQMPGAMA